MTSLLRAAWEEYERDRARYFAGAMVYFALMSLVPLLLLFLAAIGWSLRFSSAAAGIEGHVLTIVETNLGEQFRMIIETLLTQLQQQSLVTALAGLLGLLYTASKLFRHLRMSFRAIWKYEPPLLAGPMSERVATTVREYAFAFILVLSGGLLLFLALVLLSVTQRLSRLLVALPLVDRVPVWLVALPGSIAIVGLTFALLFRFLPPVRLGWRHVWLASVLCTASWIIGAQLVTWYSALFPSDAPTLEAFTGLFVTMLWFDKVSQALFYGAEVCKVLYTRETAVTASGFR
ncbi:MAG TPA: YhjD/YihY/BrkB family envelope integrity protein [Casimicrobiaceae bacterium]|nr:YhjD/YihY/BrkB family envelope integrity protein [Casimicrobiaceae bacterium]